jgi:type VI secretion system protein ImpL
LRQLQRAARIKAAFFPTNGNAPNILLTVTPRTPLAPGFTAKLEISGIPITSSSNQPTPPPVQVPWTGTPGAKTAVSVSADPPNPRTPPSEVSGGTSAWALFRLLDKTGSKSTLSNGIAASWSGYGQEASFQILTGSSINPFDPRLFTEFKCPGRL